MDAFEVSLPLLIEALPQFGLQGNDGIVECVRQGRRLGIIRPSKRLHIEAPEIPQELLIPLPKDAVLCRQPRYHREKSPDEHSSSDKPTNERSKQSSPNIEVHPQRDRIVAILLQREAEIKAAARQGRVKEQATRPKVVPIKPKARVVIHPMSPVQPDPNVVRPPWTDLVPLVASA